MQWTGERNGEYRALVHAEDRGLVQGEARGDARRQDDRQRASTHVRAVPSDAEYFDAAMQARARADRAGHRRTVLPAGDLSALADDLQYTGRGVTAIEERELWHMPIVLMALLAAARAPSGACGGGWGWREAARGMRGALRGAPMRCEGGTRTLRLVTAVPRAAAGGRSGGRAEHASR